MSNKCRFCLTSVGTGEEFVKPCQCRGKFKLAHKLCLAKWFIDDVDGKLRQEKKCENCKVNIILSNPEKLYNAFKMNHVSGLRFCVIILRVVLLLYNYVLKKNKNLLEANLDRPSDIVWLIICNLLEGFNYHLIAVFLIMKYNILFNHLKSFKSFLLIGYGFSTYSHLPTLGIVFAKTQFMGTYFIATLPPISQWVHILIPENWGNLLKLIFGSCVYVPAITLVILMLEYHQYKIQLENCRFYEYKPTKDIYVLQEKDMVKLIINKEIRVISVEQYKVLAKKLNLGKIM
ncbi:uncharacterized protein LOC119689446 [Teleopsis dalmanni]|uniref:uncharacterized protein LOC119689446 n=1 Tax=Teleopsis dalmanni TaxID=139649 RepID=UPI0018CC92EB|nr:uncharacterized protein LOC119689446 [Teleopsis dalmanni]